MSLLKQDTIRKKLVNKLHKLKLEQEFNVGDDKKYKVKAIFNIKVYTKVTIDKLITLYY